MKDKFCCETFKESVEEKNFIRKINSYQETDFFNKTKIIKIPDGYYIIDSHSEAEWDEQNFPFTTKRLKYCPWCGKEIKY